MTLRLPPVEVRWPLVGLFIAVADRAPQPGIWGRAKRGLVLAGGGAGARGGGRAAWILVLRHGPWSGPPGAPGLLASDVQAGGPGGFWWFSGLDRGARHGVSEGVLEAEGPRFALFSGTGRVPGWQGVPTCRKRRPTGHKRQPCASLRAVVYALALDEIAPRGPLPDGRRPIWVTTVTWGVA